MAGLWRGFRSAVLGPTANSESKTTVPATSPGETNIDELISVNGHNYRILDEKSVSVNERAVPLGDGAGSFGKVYPGRYNDPQKNVTISCAVKIFFNEKVSKDVIEREYALGDQESHLNIVDMYGLWFGYPAILSPSSEKLPALVMELCDTNLRKFLLRTKKGGNVTFIRLNKKLKILMDVTKAMLYLHGKGIVHGDLSAVNVLLKNTAGQELEGLLAKVTDFGQARELDQTKNRHYTSTCGNVDIMPPEITKRGDRQVVLSVYTDVFSFGCLVGFVAYCVYPQPKSGTSEFKRRDHCLEGMKTPERHKIEPLMKRCLSDEETDRGDFEEIYKYLHSLLFGEKHHGSEVAIESDIEEDMYSVQVLRAKLQGVQNSSEKQKEEYGKLKECCKKLQDDIASTDHINQLLKKDKEVLQQQLQQSEQDNVILKSKLESQQSDKQLMSESMKGIQNVVEDRLKAQSEVTELKKQLEACTLKLKEVSNERSKLDQSCKLKDGQIRTLQQQFAEAQNGSQRSTAKMTQLKDEYDSLKTLKVSVDERLRALEKKLTEISKERDKHKRDLGQSEQKRKELTKTITDMTSTATQRSKELATCKNEVTNLKRQLTKRQNELDVKIASEREASEKLSKAESKSHQLQEQNDRMTKTLQGQKSEIENLKRQLRSKEQVVVSLQSEKSTEAERATEAEKKWQKLEEQLGQLQRRVGDLQTSESRLKNRLGEAEKKRDGYFKENRQLEENIDTLQKNKASQKKELDNYKQLYKEKTKDYVNLEANFENIKQGGEDFYKETQQKMEKLKTDLDENKAAHNRTVTELNKAKQREEVLEYKLESLKDEASEKDEHMQNLEDAKNRMQGMLKDIWNHVMPPEAYDGPESTILGNDEEKLYNHVKVEFTKLKTERNEAVTLKRSSEKNRNALLVKLDASEGAVMRYKEEYQEKLAMILKMLAFHRQDLQHVVRETKSVLDYVHSQLAVAEATMRRCMTLIANEAERRLALLRKSCAEKEDSELKLVVKCSELEDQLGSLKQQLMDYHEQNQCMRKKLIQEACRNEEVLTKSAILKDRNVQLIQEKEVAMQDKHELQQRYIKAKEELSKLAKWSSMEEELLSHQDELERKETTLKIREDALNESQSSSTNTIIRKQIQKAYRDCLDHLVHESFKSVELLSSSDEDVDGTQLSMGDGEGLIRKLVLCNVKLQEESSQHKREYAELERDLKHYKHLAKNCSPTKTKSWEPPTDDVEKLKQRLSSLQSAYFDSHRYPCVLYELRSQQLHHPFQCVDGLSGEKLCFNVLLSDLTLLREAKKTFEVFKNENKLAPLIVDSRKSLEERRDSCVSAIFLHFKRMTFYRLHIMHTSKLLTHDAALHEDGVGYAIPQGYIACAQATIHKSDLIKYKITPDNQGRLDYTRKTRFEQPTPLSNPYLQAVASYLDRRIVEHLEDCYNKYGRPSMVMSVPPCGVP